MNSYCKIMDRKQKLAAQQKGYYTNYLGAFEYVRPNNRAVFTSYNFSLSFRRSGILASNRKALLGDSIQTENTWQFPTICNKKN